MTEQEHETPATGDHGRSPLAVALADLADTMPDDPYRLDAVHAKTRRFRTRRRVARASAGVAVAAATIAVVVAVRPGSTSVTTIPAVQPATTVAPLPSCADALATATAAADAKAAAAPVAATEEDTAKATAERAAAAAGAPPDGPLGTQGVKGFGVVVAATEASVTITAEPDFVPAGQPAEITAAVTADTVLLDAGTKVTTMPALNAGDRVAFGAAQVDGGYQLLLLESHPTEATGDPANTAADKDKVAVEPALTSGLSKAVAEVVAVDGGTVTLRITDGTPLDATVTTGPETAFVVGDQKCIDPQFAPGAVVTVVLTATGADTYTVDMVSLPGEPKAG